MERAAEQGERLSVRGLTPSDLDGVIAIDERITGRRRDEYFRMKFKEDLAQTGVRISLAAEVEGTLSGFLLAKVYFGEFGTLEPAAVLDTLGVRPEFQHQGVGSALLRQLRTNLAGIGVGRVQTEVGWDDPLLVGFFRREGFRMAPRICLDLELSRRPRDDGEAA